MNTKTPYLTILLVTVSMLLRAQEGFFIINNARQVDIPFEYVNNFILVKLNFNGTLPLRFIFDTGAENTILSKREISDVLHVRYDRVFKLTGSDLKTEITAYLARGIRFDIPEKVFAPREDILVLDEDYFRFEEYAGIEVHGILSANAFSRYVIKINYQRKVITLYERKHFKLKDEGFINTDIEIYRNKPYITTQLQILRDTVISVKLLLDSGAGVPLLLFSNTHELTSPPPSAIPSNIGMGLGGYLEGYTGRVYGLKMGDLAQHNILSYFQELDTSLLDKDMIYARNGLIGNIILQRFIVILDYQLEKIWLKPSKLYQDEFVYDRSGLHLIASGRALNVFTVEAVLPGSPADEVGLIKGDQLVRVGFFPASIYTLSDLVKKFQRKPGQKIRLVVKRDGKRIKKRLILRNLI